jgi:hypothetical protein
MRKITVIFDGELSPDDYADRGNGIWAMLKVAYPNGGFRIESDTLTPVPDLNARWNSLGTQCPWR